MSDLKIPTLKFNAATVFAATTIGIIANIAAPVLVYTLAERIIETCCLKLFPNRLKVKDLNKDFPFTKFENTFRSAEFAALTAKVIGVVGASLLIIKIASVSAVGILALIGASKLGFTLANHAFRVLQFTRNQDEHKRTNLPDII